MILALVILLIGVMLIFVTFKVNAMPTTPTDIGTYLDVTDSVKQLIVMGVGACAVLFFIGGLLLTIRVKSTVYARSFQLHENGIESLFKGKSEGVIPFENIEEIQMLRVPGLKLVNNVLYRAENTNNWIYIPARVGESGELLENFLTKVAPKLIAANEKVLNEKNQLSFNFLAPSDYRAFYQKLDKKLTNNPLNTQKSAQLDQLMATNAKKILVTQDGISLDGTVLNWEELTVEVHYDKHDTIIKNAQRDHEFDFICVLATAKLGQVQLQGSAISNQQVFLDILKKKAASFTSFQN
ncbi:hypothetical protein [Listeria marthii]|uniref:hypothetical protein n=1 Tax=Listeria marthii TaxID=529731 RepID=UPI00162AF4D8|nr:hypothetical protein [Listeria marthii]